MAIGRTGPATVARAVEGKKSRYLLAALVLAHLVVISRQVDEHERDEQEPAAPGRDRLCHGAARRPSRG